MSEGLSPARVLRFLNPKKTSETESASEPISRKYACSSGVGQLVGVGVGAGVRVGIGVAVAGGVGVSEGVGAMT